MDRKIKQILEAVDLYNKDYGFGLLNGHCGVALLYYYSTIISSKNEDKCIESIDKALGLINKGPLTNSFCSGIAGFGWTLEFLKSNNIFTIRDISLLDDLDDFFYRNMIIELKNNHYDYLHGAIGYGLYFLKRLHKPNSKLYLTHLVNRLEFLADTEADLCIKWKSTIDYTKNTKGYNISLSHGMASIVVVLTKIFKAGIETNKCSYLITHAIRYILNQELDKNTYHSYFPMRSIESEINLVSSRLAWCYGDLGIAMSLWQAGQTLNNLEWVEKSMEVLLYSTTRKDLKSNSVYDSCMCHGTAGIGHIFYRMYWNTKRDEFKTAADYWFEETIKMAYHKGGLAGYKTKFTVNHGEWIDGIGLLGGISGIGLALLSYHYEIEPDWDECLLLS